jgi:hypothetical protein
MTDGEGGSGAVLEEGPGESDHHATHQYKANDEEAENIFLAGQRSFQIGDLFSEIANQIPSSGVHGYLSKLKC